MSRQLLATWPSDSVGRTMEVARLIASYLSAGDCVGLGGDLGAGKTQIVRGIVEALGGDGRAVSSPTFVLLHVYQTPRMPVFHVDAYRIRSADEVEGIGFAELLSQQGLMLVEWPGRIAESLPPDRYEISVVPTGETLRTIELYRCRPSDESTSAKSARE